MSHHKRRLEKMEEQFQRGMWRCDVCHGWPEHRLLYGPVYQEMNGPPSDYPPEECENCGFQPMVIAVEYANDWKAL